jgi:hypothetical protein
MLAEVVDAVVGVDTHRDTHEVEIALPTGTPIATHQFSNDSAGSRLGQGARQWHGVAAARLPGHVLQASAASRPPDSNTTVGLPSPRHSV